MKKAKLLKRILNLKGMKSALVYTVTGAFVIGYVCHLITGKSQTWESRVESFKTTEYIDAYEKGMIIGDNLEATIDGRGNVTVKNTVTGENTIKGLKIDWICESNGDSLAVFCLKDKRGYFNSYTGRIAIEPTYRRAWIFSDGLAAVQRDGMIGFLDHNGNTVIGFNYPYYGNPLKEFVFKNGHCIVADSTGHCGVIDKTGTWVIEPIYDRVSITKEYAIVTREGVSQQIDYDGKVINPFLVDYVTPLTIYVTERFMNKDGEVKFEEYEKNTGFFRYYVGNRYGLLDKNCHVITPAEYKYIEALNDHTFRATLLDGTSEVLLDENGRIICQNCM